MPERIRALVPESDGDELVAAFDFRNEGEGAWVARCKHFDCGAEWDVLSIDDDASRIVVSRSARNSLLAHSRSHGMKPQLRRRK